MGDFKCLKPVEKFTRHPNHEKAHFDTIPGKTPKQPPRHRCPVHLLDDTRGNGVHTYEEKATPHAWGASSSNRQPQPAAAAAADSQQSQRSKRRMRRGGPHDLRRGRESARKFGEGNKTKLRMPKKLIHSCNSWLTGLRNSCYFACM